MSDRLLVVIPKAGSTNQPLFVNVCESTNDALAVAELVKALRPDDFVSLTDEDGYGREITAVKIRETR